MPILSRLTSKRPLTKNFKGVVMILTPALLLALGIAACTGHSESGSEAAANTGTSDGKDRAPAADQGKSGDESLAGFVTATTPKEHKRKAGGKVARQAAGNVYVVQIGAFRVRENAEKLNEKLKGQGYPVVMQSLEHSSNGRLFLVRLNPTNDRKEAEEMRMNLKAKADIDSMILALPKAEREVSSNSAPVEAPAKDSAKASANGVEASTAKAASEVH